MKDLLREEYELLMSHNKKTNGFSKMIENNKILRDELEFRSGDILNYYKKPNVLQRLRFIFSGESINLCKCGSPLSWRNFYKGYNKTCGSKECVTTKSIESTKKFYKEKFGVEHLFQTEKFKRDLKEKFKKRMGVDNPWKSEEIKEKIKETNLKKFGVDSWLKVKENREYISEKIRKDHERKREEIIKNNNINIEILEINNGFNTSFFCMDCKTNSTVSQSYFNKKIKIGKNPCIECTPFERFQSDGEIEVHDFIKENYDGIIIKNYRGIKNKEIDIYLPDLSIGFEFDGIYFHSEIFKGKTGNIEKKESLIKEGIKLYNIWEDDWNHKKDIIKSRILSAIGKIPIKIYARSCDIRMVDKRTTKKFLEENHIQGYAPSTINIGLFHLDSIVSIMTFGGKRIIYNQKSEEGVYEMIRFSNKKNHTVIGGATKLFKFFINSTEFKEIISYQDNSWGAGNLYKNLGFSIEKNPTPNYYWCKGNIKFHRFNFRKDKLIKEGFDAKKTESDIMMERGYYKLWDYGNIKWIYKKGLD